MSCYHVDLSQSEAIAQYIVSGDSVCMVKGVDILKLSQGDSPHSLLCSLHVRGDLVIITLSSLIRAGWSVDQYSGN